MPATVDEHEEQGESIEVQEDLNNGDDQEVEIAKKARNPLLPSSEEVDDHRCAGHTQYRTWCRECIEGQAVGEHHRADRNRVKLIPTIAFDYFYVTSGGVQRRHEIANE